MSTHPLHQAVCRLRAAHGSPWNSARRRAYLAAVQAQTHAMIWREIIQQRDAAMKTAPKDGAKAS